MPFETGYWGKQAKVRSKKRLDYFKAYQRMHGPPKKVFRLGVFGELLAQRKLTGSKLVNQPGYDLVWNQQRVEVKTSESPATDKRGVSSYVFDIRTQKREEKTDYFLCLMLDEHTKSLRYAYLIPDEAVSAKVGLHITPGRSRYDRWRFWLKTAGADDRV